MIRTLVATDCSGRRAIRFLAILAPWRDLSSARNASAINSSDARRLNELVRPTFRISDRHRDDADARGLGFFESERGGTERGAGGHDVIDQHDMFAADGFVFEEAECVAQIVKAFGLRMQRGLWTGLAKAHQRRSDGLAGNFRQSLGNYSGLIVTA